MMSGTEISKFVKPILRCQLMRPEKFDFFKKNIEVNIYILRQLTAKASGKRGY